MRNLYLLVLIFAAQETATAARILMVVPTPTKSHHNLFDRLAVEIANKNHRVTLITAFPQPNARRNVEEIIYPNYYDKLMAPFRGSNSNGTKFMSRFNTFFSIFALHQLGLSMTDMFLSIPIIKEFLKSDRNYDIVIGEAFFIEGVLAGLARKYDAPLIVLSTSMPSFWVNHMVGNPSPSSYVPSLILGYSDKMSFLQRLTNLIYETISDVAHSLLYLPKQDTIMRKHFGNHLPYVGDIITNTSLVLVNHHHSLAFPRPYLPNMIEIAGYHVPRSGPLSKDLKAYLDEANQGVILFSMGSHLKSSNLPKEKLHTFINVFSKLKQKVLWKFEDQELPGLPKNVRIMKWLPQSDILAHPNVKLFISHGGLLSTIEAVVRAVPILGLPVFGDQPSNMLNIERKGYGKMLLFEEFTETSLHDAILEMLNNPTYKANIKRGSVLLQDTPMSAVDTAIYWVEYVIRHKGAPHLRSAALGLKWYELYLLDVIGVLALGTAILAWLCYRIAKCTCSVICRKKMPVSAAKKKREEMLYAPLPAHADEECKVLPPSLLWNKEANY